MLIASEAKQVITLKAKSLSSFGAITLPYPRAKHSWSGETSDRLKSSHDLDGN